MVVVVIRKSLSPQASEKTAFKKIIINYPLEVNNQLCFF